ncbi:MAG: hypothetical protein JWN91_272 [Nocardioides sp.]|nr:hypothetical protein [Nocardioides sp.]
MPRRDEQGAVVPLVAILLTTLLGITALTVDIGVQRVARADMQAVADMVALDLARELDGRAASAIQPGLQAAADRSLARNADTAGDAASVVPELGTLTGTTFAPASGATIPDAVRVSASTSVDFSFRPGSGGAGRTALAVARAQGCYKLGSWGARLGTTANANLVYRVLAAHGVGASVTAATYQGLAGAVVDAADLATALGLASPEALGTASVRLSTLLDAAAQVVGRNGATAGQVAALHAVRANLGTLGNQSVGLANLFTVGAGAGAGLTAAVDLADLVIGAILVADGNSAVAVDLGTGLPGVGSFVSSVGLIQAARTACGFAGSTPNSSNQVAITSHASLTDQSLPIGVPGLAAVTVGSATPMTLTVTTASATSTLDAITCGSSSRSATVSTSGGLLSASIVIPVSLTVTVGVAPLAVRVPLTATFRATLTPSGTPGSVTITVPSQAYGTPYSNGGAQAQLPTVTLDPVGSVAGITTAQLTDLTDAVASTIVQPLVTALNATVLGPLSDLAGLRTAGADVLLLDQPTCTTPALKG